jgi:2-amino-4-ketopentanoate thiolase alpha subunit
MIKKNTYVQIYQIALSTSQRSENLPPDTMKVPFEVRIKGLLVEDTHIGDMCIIKTRTNRLEKGVLIAVEPYFKHSFGYYVEELKRVEEIILKETEDLS